MTTFWGGPLAGTLTDATARYLDENGKPVSDALGDLWTFHVPAARSKKRIGLYRLCNGDYEFQLDERRWNK